MINDAENGRFFRATKVNSSRLTMMQIVNILGAAKVDNS